MNTERIELALAGIKELENGHQHRLNNAYEKLLTWYDLNDIEEGVYALNKHREIPDKIRAEWLSDILPFREGETITIFEDGKEDREAVCYRVDGVEVVTYGIDGFGLRCYVWYKNDSGGYSGQEFHLDKNGKWFYLNLSKANTGYKGFEKYKYNDSFVIVKNPSATY
jgi:hypothetical protein